LSTVQTWFMMLVAILLVLSNRFGEANVF
jgi:hypothetical protein